MRVLLFLILILAAFLRLFGLPTQMPFFQDMGWFYISARNILIYHQIPLVGITSSHTWLHQGPLWTYLLSVIFALFKYNPVVPAYFIVLIGVITVFLVYKVSSLMFSERVGLLAAFFYATSPLITEDSKIAYHTSLIPFFALVLIFLIFKWVSDKKSMALPFIFFTLGILYNLEIATFALFVCFGVILIYGLLRKKTYALKIIKPKIIIYSVIAFVIPMFPMILYDIHHGFPQTIKFVIWIVYRVAVILGYPGLHPGVSSETWATFFPFTINIFKNMLFLENSLIALVILVSVLVVLVYRLIKDWRSKILDPATIILFIFLCIPIFTYIAEKTNSAAYLLMFYPQVAIGVAFLANFFMKKKSFIIPVVIIFALICFINSYFYIKGDNFRYITYSQRLENAKQILKIADGRDYNIIGKGQGSQYESFITPYEYLTWHLGNPPSEQNQKLKFYVSENTDKIKMEVKD